MRTLHLDVGDEMRGGQWQVLRLMRGLVARGDQPLLMARKDGPLFARAEREGLPVQPFRGYGLPDLDLVHAHDARAHAAAAIAWRGPLVVSRRVAFPVKKGWISRWKYRRADLYIAVSRFVASVLEEAGVDAAKIRVVPDGVPLLPIGARSGGVITPAVKSGPLTAGFPVSTDLEKDLATAALMVYVTESEGLGSAVLLALSAGVPVVASNVGGIPEIVEPGADGLLVENTRGAIDAAVKQILSDPSSYGRESRRKIAERFSEERMVEATVQVYREVVS